jgi:hypothetical protein
MALLHLCKLMSLQRRSIVLLLARLPLISAAARECSVLRSFRTGAKNTPPALSFMYVQGTSETPRHAALAPPCPKNSDCCARFCAMCGASVRLSCRCRSRKRWISELLWHWTHDTDAEGMGSSDFQAGFIRQSLRYNTTGCKPPRSI